MLVGVFLRFFKTYKNARYIPFTIDDLNKFNLFIGQNGAGKSSILESLDYFFNNRDFIYNTNQNKNDAFVAPLFMIKKNELKKFDREVQEIIPIISEYFFEADINTNVNFKSYPNFFNHRDSLKRFNNDHYLILLGCAPQTDLINNAFITFNSVVKSKIIEKNKNYEDDKKLRKLLERLRADLINLYSYQYIPVETSLNDFLRLESKGMQDLMSENVKGRIEKLLNEKLPIKADRPQSKSLLDIVNNDLEDFVGSVANTIQLIDDKYDFEKEYKAKTKLTANHLTDIIVDSFFSKRKLKRDGKPIENMSAGERKKALIDIAYAFLTQERKLSQNIILAIDEPESSLHISMCYDQFNRLQKLAKDYNIQLFVATHWYGALPIIDQGTLHHIQTNDTDAIEIKPFSFSNYFSKQRNHPDDIQFKSYFDLVSSIISCLRLQEINWLIVESEDDKKYICKHLKDEVKKKVKFLPVGSCATVAVLYNYLHTPIEQGHDNNTFKGKIFCLIDTDIQGVKFSEKSDVGNIMRIRRLQSKNQKIELHHIDSTVHYPTEIEEALVPKAFYTALSNAINQSDEQDIKDIFSKFKFDESALNSYIKGDDSIIYLATDQHIEGNPKHLKDEIHKFIDRNKAKLCDLYCEQDISEKPDWISHIENYLA